MDKNKKTFQVPTLLAFAAIVAIMVIVGVRVLNVPVVPMCLLVIIEAVIAVMLHHAELLFWQNFVPVLPGKKQY